MRCLKWSAGKNKMQDKQAIDNWSLIHFAAGVALGYFVKNQKYAISGILIYENLEPKIWPGYRESKRNIAADMVIGIAGVEVGRRLRGRKA